MLAADFARFPEIEKDTRRAVDAMTCREGCPNQAKEAGVFLRALRNRLLKPLVVAARRDAENTTHRLHGVLASMGLDELIRRPNSPGARLRGHWHRPSRVEMLNHCPLNPGNSMTDGRSDGWAPILSRERPPEFVGVARGVATAGHAAGAMHSVPQRIAMLAHRGVLKREVVRPSVRVIPLRD